MCGLAGFLLRSSLENPKDVLTSMGRELHHRGPDDGSHHFDAKSGLGLVHRRLSIIDLSPSGLQPMTSASGRYQMVYNGEIYNFQELRRELGTQTGNNGHGDSALILEAFDAIGVEASLKKFRGMFAIAVHDLETRCLILARDTVGIKPLYYGSCSNGTLIFGSELKSLEAHPHFNSELDPEGLNLLLRFGNIPQPHSIYKDVKKLPPGHMLSIDTERGSLDGVTPSPFRSPLDCAKKGWENPFEGDRHEATEEIHRALKSSVSEHMVSDVPLGAFLSGGVDSSLVCALAQDTSSAPLKTFTIGFDEKEFNEAQHAKAVASHLNTEHHELTLTPKELEERLPVLISHLDEPFADSSFLPTYMVSEMTRQHVTVSLSGDGGDELYGGYERYRWTPQIWKQLSSCPTFFQKIAGAVGRGLSQRTWNGLAKPLGPLLPHALKGHQFGSRVHRMSRFMGAHSPRELYQRLMTHFDSNSGVLRKHSDAQTILDHDNIWNLRQNLPERLMLIDLLTYLSDDILTKVDRASMAVSLESRVPLLTPELIQLAWSLPAEWRQNKALLKDILYRYVPQDLIERPKMGFGVPVGHWMRGPLRTWAEDLLCSGAAKEESWFNHRELMSIWKEHSSGRADRTYELWNILCFLQWKLSR